MSIGFSQNPSLQTLPSDFPGRGGLVPRSATKSGLNEESLADMDKREGLLKLHTNINLGKIAPMKGLAPMPPNGGIPVPPRPKGIAPPTHIMPPSPPPSPPPDGSTVAVEPPSPGAGQAKPPAPTIPDGSTVAVEPPSPGAGQAKPPAPTTYSPSSSPPASPGPKAAKEATSAPTSRAASPVNTLIAGQAVVGTGTPSSQSNASIPKGIGSTVKMYSSQVANVARNLVLKNAKA